MPQLGSLMLDGEDVGVELAWVDWGAAAATRTVVCVHGLTRNSRDFDPLAEALAGRGARVIAVDVAGRGRSSWLADPAAYALPTYVRQLTELLGRLGLAEIDWVGTSMGGLIGMFIAAGGASPIRRLVLNDIGPFVPRQALAEIAGYVGRDPLFAGLDGLERHLREVHAGFGPLSDLQWRHLACHSARPDGAGWRLRYDPAIGTAFRAGLGADLDLWPLWERMACPVLVLRGAESPLLLPATVEAMGRQGPPLTAAVVDGVGHAPALMADAQIAIIAAWLGLPAASGAAPD